jgi:hypothetical protein
MTIDNGNTPYQQAAPEVPESVAPGSQPEPRSEPEEMSPEQRRAMITIGVVILVIILVSVGLTIGLAYLPAERVAHIRDIFIIWLAIMSLLIGTALVILMIQMARLINLLQNEIKPILDSTNETVSHLRGTTVFLSDNLTEPVIKANEYIAGISQFLATIGFIRKPIRSSKTSKPKESE